MLGFKDNP